MSLHRDVIVVTSALLQVNCVIVRRGEETFVIDSPVLPDELDALPALLEQARFASPSGLLATHGDWDHLLGRLAFPGLALGCAESTAERLRASPGEAQRALRAFDEELMIERPRPLALGSLLLVIVSFILLAHFSGASPDSTYIPAHIENGKFVPGVEK